MPETSRRIHERALSRAKTFRAAEIEIIESLREVEDDRTYLHFELTSVYAYAMKVMNLSENIACTLIAIMRKSRIVPELADAIRTGAITTSKAAKIAPVLTQQNKEAWLELASTKTSREIEKAVVTQNPKLATLESLRPTSVDRLELKLGVSEEWARLLERVKDVISQKTGAAASTEDSLALVMREYLKRNDPLLKAERANERSLKIQSEEKLEAHINRDDSTTSLGSAIDVEIRHSPFPGKVNPPKRIPLPAAVKHAVIWRDQCRCTHVDVQNKRCTNKRWLDVHHILPIARGGTNDIQNLETLCSAHHRIKHE